MKADGSLVCPHCGYTISGFRIFPDSEISRASLFCRRCKQVSVIHVTGPSPTEARATAYLL